MTQSQDETRGFDWTWAADEEGWVPPGIDPSKPSVARIYDWYLDGKDNYAADRSAGQRAQQLLPDVKQQAKINRMFLCEAVERMARDGITQFIDLGAGIPTRPNVHEVARRVHPDASVAYVDSDPVAAIHARALLATSSGILVVEEDLRDPDAVLSSPGIETVIDFDRPVGLLFFAVLHFVEHELSLRMLSQYLRRVPSGSQLALSTSCSDGSSPDLVEELTVLYSRTPNPVVFRSTAQIEGLFDGLRLQEPGIVTLGQYTESLDLFDDTSPSPRMIRALCGVGLKP